MVMDGEYIYEELKTFEKGSEDKIRTREIRGMVSLVGFRTENYNFS